MTDFTDHIDEITWDGAATISVRRRKEVDGVMLALPRTLMSILIFLFRSPPDDFHFNTLSAMQKTACEFSDEEVMHLGVFRKLI